MDCAVCCPLKSAQDKRLNNIRPGGQPLENRPQLSDPGASASEPQNNPDLMRAYLALGLSPPGLSQPRQQDLSASTQPSTSNIISSGMAALAAPVNTHWLAQKNVSETVATQPHKSDTSAMVVGNSAVTGLDNTSAAVGFVASVEVPHQTQTQESKSWHDAVTADLRNHLVYKL